LAKQHVAEKTRTALRLSQLKTAQQSLGDDLAGDAEFQKEWQRTALARALALVLLRYRKRHTLTQAALAKRLGFTQPQVARMEAAEVVPELETLLRVAQALKSEFLLSIRPETRQRRWTTERAERADVIEKFKSRGSRILIAAS
jgi:transcriptional regulator with XRE-family HTH domain